jgi:hypothetical protein
LPFEANSGHKTYTERPPLRLAANDVDDGARAATFSHNPEVKGSNPSPATIESPIFMSVRRWSESLTVWVRSHDGSSGGSCVTNE